jgi:16S rRNA (guanine966-N2)-methyltransferase
MKMHISAGKYKRRKLAFPKNRAFRPTKSIVREAIFSMIGPSIEGASFLDLCTGSGAMGLEAESRGAQQVVCVDKDIRFLNENIALLGATVNGVRSDAIRYLKTLQKSAFDFIYFDPVWADHHMYIAGLTIIFDNQLVSESGQLFVEHDRSFVIPDQFQQHITDTKKYGDSLVSVWKK